MKEIFVVELDGKIIENGGNLGWDLWIIRVGKCSLNKCNIVEVIDIFRIVFDYEWILLLVWDEMILNCIVLR